MENGNNERTNKPSGSRQGEWDSVSEMAGKMGQNRTEDKAARRREALMQWMDEKRNDPKYAEGITYQAGEISDLEDFFKRRLAKFKGEGQDMPQKEFEKIEDEYAGYWNILNRELMEIGYDYDYSPGGDSAQYQAKAEAPMFPAKGAGAESSILAYSGRLYPERAQALRDAIKDSDKSSKEADLDKLGGFWTVVAKHANLVNMNRHEISYKFQSYEDYDRSRTKAHNDVITYLNELNDLTKRYQVHPFLPRRLWRSDETKEDAKKRSIDEQDRLYTDRCICQGFYKNAFARGYRTIQERHQQTNYERG